MNDINQLKRSVAFARAFKLGVESWQLIDSQDYSLVGSFFTLDQLAQISNDMRSFAISHRDQIEDLRKILRSDSSKQQKKAARTALEQLDIAHKGPLTLIRNVQFDQFSPRLRSELENFTDVSLSKEARKIVSRDRLSALRLCLLNKYNDVPFESSDFLRVVNELALEDYERASNILKR